MKKTVKIFSFLVLLILFIPQNILGKEYSFAKNTFVFSTQQKIYSFHFKNIPLHNAAACRFSKGTEEKTEEITHNIKSLPLLLIYCFDSLFVFLSPLRSLNLCFDDLYFKKTLYLLYQSLRL
jgi:hypothetical protein